MKPEKPPKIFLSYCHANISKARKIESDLSVLNIEIVRDERALKYTEDIESYMQTIRVCDYAIVLVSDAFLKSVACMFEVNEFFKDENHRNRILPVIIKTYSEGNATKHGAMIYRNEDVAGYVRYWQNQEKQVRSSMKGLDIANISHLSMELSLIQSITKTVSEFIFLLKKTKHVSFDDLIKNNYSDLLTKIGYEETGLNNIRKARSLYSQAIAEVTLEKRLSFLNKAIDLDPFYAEALNKRGQVYDELKKFDDAIKSYNRAIEIHPYKAASYISRSYAFIRKEEIKEALTDLDMAISLEPFRKEAYNNRADAYRRIRKYHEAITDCQKALEIDPEFDLAYATLAEIAAAQHIDPEFYNYIEKAVKLGFPLHKYAFDNVYEKYKEQKIFQELIELSERTNKRFI